ncbi:hypothetical protein BD414DRAFT_580665 [Trametes punicea]|nr:hypothetical protein BD414DRAFT_580665 [Trametes punicea]
MSGSPYRAERPRDVVRDRRRASPSSAKPRRTLRPRNRATVTTTMLAVHDGVVQTRPPTARIRRLPMKWVGETYCTLDAPTPATGRGHTGHRRERAELADDGAPRRGPSARLEYRNYPRSAPPQGRTPQSQELRDRTRTSKNPRTIDRHELRRAENENEKDWEG